jgi:aminoglycoside phosphotransferase (APT) family kinase protein
MSEGMRLGQRIGEGGCAEVFEWGDGKVLKLFRSNTDIYAVNREYRNSRMAWQVGLPAARAYELLELNGRLGIVFERLEGQTMTERFYSRGADQPTGSGGTEEVIRQLDEDVRQTARILFKIHSCAIPEDLGQGLEQQRDYLKEAISRQQHLTEAEKASITAILDALPLKRRLCHGDPNPGNVFMTSAGPVMIDWMDTTVGNPEGDLAEYVILLRYAVLPPETPDLVVSSFHAWRSRMEYVFMEEYTKLSGVTAEDVEAWVVPTAARKLAADAISEAEKAILVKVIRERLKGRDEGIECNIENISER